MQQARYSVCPCSRPMPRGAERCQTCSQTATKRRSQPDALPTPPTSSPRRSTTSTSRTSSASEAFTNALSSEPDASPGLFPSNIYRLPSRAASNSPVRRPSDSSSVSSSRTSSTCSGLPSRAATPEARYSPMAAGFASLGRHHASRKNDGGMSGLEASMGRMSVKEGQRASLGQDRMMFSGPA